MVTGSWLRVHGYGFMVYGYGFGVVGGNDRADHCALLLYAHRASFVVIDDEWFMMGN